jgi:hypothetical protein
MQRKWLDVELCDSGGVCVEALFLFRNNINGEVTEVAFFSADLDAQRLSRFLHFLGDKTVARASEVRWTLHGECIALFYVQEANRNGRLENYGVQ